MVRTLDFNLDVVKDKTKHSDILADITLLKQTNTGTVR